MERRIKHTLLTFILAFTICAAPFVDAKRADAIAPAIPAIAGAGALAAELGITTEALMTGLLCVTAAGTGVYLMQSSDGSVTLSDLQWRGLWGDSNIPSDPGYSQNWDSAYTGYKLGNGKSWDELTNEEKQNWASPAEYVQGQWLAYALENGLIQETGNGGYEPTPEPDPNTDPDGNAKWHKTRNTLTALGVGGAAVALNEGVGWLGETIGNGIHDLLFGTGNTVNTGLGYQYTAQYNLGTTRPVVFAAFPGLTFEEYGIDYSFNTNQWYAMQKTSTGNTFVKVQDNSTPTLNFSYQGNPYVYLKSNQGISSSRFLKVSNDGSISYVGGGQYSPEIPDGSESSTQKVYLNSNYGGVYNFPNNVTYANGQLSDPTLLQDVDYGQMVGTPEDLASAVTNNNTWITYINDATDDVPEGKKKAVTIPANLDDVEYDDIVNVVDEEEVTPIPDDEPIPGPGPGPGPGPETNPDPDFDYDESLTEQVNRLLANPFDQLFPFCLIGDFRDFIFIIMGHPEMAQRIEVRTTKSGNRSNTPVEELNGTETLTIPLNDWGIEGVDNIEFDLNPVHDLGRYVRVVITVFLIMGIVMYSFTFFLNRGGE